MYIIEMYEKIQKNQKDEMIEFRGDISGFFEGDVSAVYQKGDKLSAETFVKTLTIIIGKKYGVELKEHEFSVIDDLTGFIPDGVLIIDNDFVGKNREVGLYWRVNEGEHGGG
eukprot:289302_1